MNFPMRSSETSYCCFSSESCPPVKIFHPRHYQWNIRTQTGWSCRGRLSVGPIYASFNVPDILDKMSMFRKSKSKMMFLSESIRCSLSGPDLSHNSVKYHGNLLQFWLYYVHKSIHAGFLTKMQCTDETEKDECEDKVTELMVDLSPAPLSWLFAGLKREIWLCLDVNTDV